MSTFRIVRFDDWEALYIDDECVCQNHQITVSELATHLRATAGVDIEIQWVKPDSELEKFVESEGCLPDDLFDHKSDVE